MQTNPQTAPAPSEVDDDDDVHLICCDDNTALCGVPLAGDWIDELLVINATITTPTLVPICRRCAYLRAELVPCTEPRCA